MRRAPEPFVLLVTSRRSGAGKTTLVEGLIPALRALGVRCAAVKLTHHDVELDPPGKDTRRLREAGAEAVVLSGPTRLTAFATSDAGSAPHLGRAIAAAALLAGSARVVLVEGGRSVPGFPRIEVVAAGDSPVSEAKTVLAIASAAPDEVGAPLRRRSAWRRVPVLGRDDYAAMAALVAQRVPAEPRVTSARKARRLEPASPAPVRAARPARSSARASSGARRGPRR